MLINNNFIEEGEWLLRNTWIDNTFTYSEEKYILKNFKNVILTLHQKCYNIPKNNTPDNRSIIMLIIIMFNQKPN